MDIEKIKELIKLMNEENLAEIEIEEEGKRIKLRKMEERLIKEVLPQTTVEVKPEVRGEKAEEKEAGIAYITAPIVGTFYRAPAPDAPPYVEVGDEVEVGQTVCIIEAMKLMNEIKSEYKGKILEVLVENGNPVEYGQPLFKIQLSQ
jgi:oxaloacetate decarboxylase alpha subunit